MDNANNNANTQQIIYLNNILCAINGLCIVKPNIILNEKMTDLLVEKGRKQVALSFSDEDHSTMSASCLMYIFININTDIFQLINRIMVFFNKRIRAIKEIKNDDMRKYEEIIAEFQADAVLETSSFEAYITKKEIVAFFNKWCEQRCVKITSSILFSVINVKMGKYKNSYGWKGYKLNYGISEDDFEID